MIAKSSFTPFKGLAATVTWRVLRVTLASSLLLLCEFFISMITDKQKRFLRAKAHHLKPVVMVGNAGLSEGVLNEVEIALSHHELIKVRISADRDERKSMASKICENTNADLVQLIGGIAILYRAAKKPSIELPKA